MAQEKWLTQLIVEAARKSGALHVEGEGPVYTDAHIEHCAKLYQDNPIIRERGVLFITFVAFPEECMRALAGGSAMPLPADAEYYPLLEPQRAVRDRLDDDRAQDREVRAQISELDRLLKRKAMRVANGAVIEPMHHKRHRRQASYPPLIDMDMGA